MPSSFRFKTLLAEETIIFWASTGQLCKHQNQVPDKSAIVEAWGGGGGVLWEFLGGDVPLGPWAP